MHVAWSWLMAVSLWSCLQHALAWFFVVTVIASNAIGYCSLENTNVHATFQLYDGTLKSRNGRAILELCCACAMVHTCFMNRQADLMPGVLYHAESNFTWVLALLHPVFCFDLLISDILLFSRFCFDMLLMCSFDLVSSALTRLLGHGLLG